MSKKLFSKKNFRTLGIVVLCLGLAFAASMAFLISGTAMFVSIAIGGAVAVMGVAIIILAYKTVPGELPPVNYKDATLKLTLTAMFIGLAALTKLFAITIPIFGSAGMRVGLSGIFSIFPAILFGPIYGGMSGAVLDIIGWMIDPQGGFNPLFTITAFIGGCVKGLVWLVFKKTDAKKLRKTVIVCFAVILALGTVFYVSLSADGINKSIIAKAEDMPSKGLVNNSNYSFFTGLIVKRIGESDTYTITKVEDAEKVVIPSKITVDGASGKLALSGTAFEGNENIKEIYLPDVISSLNISSLNGKSVTIFLTENSPVLETVKNSGLDYQIVDTIPQRMAVIKSEDMVFEELTFVSNNNYGKKLAGNINFIAFGLSLVGVLGLIAVAAEYFWSKNRSEKSPQNHTWRIFTAIFTAELIQTTINTIILKELTFKSTWAAYPFMIVWVPRVAEGLIVCVVQAYLITLLYSLLKGKIGLIKFPER